MGVLLAGCGSSRGDKNPLDISTLDPFTQAVVYAKNGDYAKLEACIEANGNIVVTRNARGKTLLHYAAIASQLDTVEILLYYGSDVNARDFIDNQTPLQAAEAERADEAVIQLLRKVGGT
jgi:ankyrin repeat protein